jgi:hypothetical protein
MDYVADIHHGYDFDSSIDPPYFAEDRVSFEFTIILRIYMEQVNPPDGKNTFSAPDHNGTRWPALRWNRASWIYFTDRYRELVTKVWDRAFILIPPAKYNGFVWPEGGRRRVLLCRLRPKIVDSAKNAHAAIQVVRLATPSKSAFRSNSGLYDNGDVILSKQRFASQGATFLHNTPAHEVGHLLGLWHVGSGNPDCKDEGDAACYGSNLNERMNVMGGGGMLDLSNALPWLARVPEHVPSTKRADWKADWASNEAQLRGRDGLEVDEAHKVQRQAPKPGMIDL